MNENKNFASEEVASVRTISYNDKCMIRMKQMAYN